MRSDGELKEIAAEWTRYFLNHCQIVENIRQGGSDYGLQSVLNLTWIVEQLNLEMSELMKINTFIQKDLVISIRA